MSEPSQLLNRITALESDVNTLRAAGADGAWGGGIQARVGSLETGMDKLETRLDSVDSRLRAVETTVARTEGKIDVLVSQVVSKLPTWWQMPVVIGSTIALLALLYAGAQKLHLFGL